MARRTFRPMVLLVAVAAGLSQSLATQPLPQPDSSIGVVSHTAEAAAVATAVLAHDQSVRTIEYEVVVERLFPNKEVSEENWVMTHRSGHGFDESGAWYADVTKWWVRGHPDSEDMEFARIEYRTPDGSVQETLNHQNTSGLIKPSDRTILWFPNPSLFLGRMVATDAKQRLGELLLQSPDLKLEQSPPELPGCIRLRGTVSTGGMIAVLVVDTKPSYGFLPVRIETRESMLDFPIEVMSVTEAKEFGGVWVPVRGIRETFYCCEWGEGVHERLNEAFEEAGFSSARGALRPDVKDPEIRARYLRVVRTFFGPDGVPFRPMDGSPQRFRVEGDVLVNQPISPGKFRVKWPDSAKWIDVFKGVDQDGRRIEDPDEELP